MRSVVALALIAFVSICLVSCGKPKKKQTKAYPVIAVAVEAQGNAGVSPAGNDLWLAAEAGTSIFDGDTIWTGPGSTVFFLMVDGSEMAVAENSILEMSTRSRGLPRVELARGEVWVEGTGDKIPVVGTPAAAVTPDVRVKSASLGVRVEPGGTTTVISAAGDARLENSAGKSTVMAGNKSTCAMGMAPEKPVMVGSEGTTPTAMSLSFLVELQEDPYFSNKATREAAEEEARANLSTSVNEAWPHVDLARAVLDAGDLAEARAQFEQALSLDPQLSQAFAGLGKIDLLEGKWKEASDAYASARRADPKSIEAVFGMGQAALGRGDLREAQKWYKETLSLDPEGTNPLVGLAIIDLLNLDLDGAMENLQRAARNEPENTKAYQVMAIIYSLRKDFDRTEAYLKKALEVNVDDYHARNTLGVLYMRMGMTSGAQDCFKQLVGSQEKAMMAAGYQNIAASEQLNGNPRSARDNWVKSHDLLPGVQQVLIDMGQAHLLLDEKDAATATFSQVTTTDPDNWLPHEWLSRAYLSAGALEYAASESRAALAQNPSAWISHLVLGLSLDMTGDAAGARLELDKGRELMPRRKLSASEHVLLGESYERQGNLSKALDQYKAAAKIAPRDAGNNILVGEAQESLKRNGEALKAYRKALEIDPSSSRARIRAAAIIYSKGDRAGAIKELERGLEHNPNDAAARKQLAEYLLEDGDVEGALFQLGAAAAIPGIRPDLLAGVLVTRGNAHDRKEEFAVAIEDYGQAITADPSRGDAWYYLAGDLERAGRVPEAKAAYQKAVEFCQGRPEWQKFYNDAASKI